MTRRWSIGPALATRYKSVVDELDRVEYCLREEYCALREYERNRWDIEADDLRQTILGHEVKLRGLREQFGDLMCEIDKARKFRTASDEDVGS